MKILIVDDSPHDRDATYFFLENNGYTDIEVAQTGEEGIEKAIDLNPDVVILDVVLPDMQGYGICKALKAQDQLKCKVILMTGEFDQNEPFKASQAAPDYFLAKTGAYKLLVDILQKIEKDL